MRLYFTSALILLACTLVYCQPSGMEEAGQYQNRAAAKLLSGDLGGAVQQLETAAALYEAAEEWEYYFSCLNQATNAYLSLGQPEEAKRTAKKALWESIQRLGRDNDEAAKAAHRLAEVYSRAGRHSKALEVHNMGLMIRESIYGSHHTQLANSYDWIGRARVAAGDYDEAADLYRRAMNLRKELLGGQHPDIAISYTNLANLKAAQGNYPRALAHFQTAYSITRSQLGKKHPDVAAALTSMARINRWLGKEETAARQYREAALLYQRIPDARGEQAAEAFHELAVQYYEGGRLNAAAHFGRMAVQALAIHTGQRPEQAYEYHLLLGTIQQESGQYEQAAGSFRQALHVAPAASAACYQQWVEALRRSGRRPEALEAATRFLSWAKGQPGPYAMLRARMQLAALLIESGQVEEGIRHIARVLNHRATPFRLLQEANSSLADAYRAKGEYDKAIQKYKQLAAEWEQSPLAGASFFRFRALLALGGTHCQLAFQDRNTLYNLEAALNAFETSDKLLSNLLLTPLSARQLSFLSEARQSFYHDAVRACYSLYQQQGKERYLRRAFFFSERSKQLKLQLPLLTLPPASFAGAPQSLLDREATTRRAAQLLLSALEYDHFEGGVLDSVRHEARKREMEYQAVVAELKQKAPRYYLHKFGSTVAMPEDVLSIVEQYSATLYAYHIGREGLYIFSFAEEGYELYHSPAGPGLENSLKAFIQAATHAPDGGGTPEERYRQVAGLAAELYDKLLPAAPAPSGAPVFLLPDGLLQWLPFAALVPEAPPDGDFTNLPYLGLNHSLAYHYSATTLSDALEDTSSSTSTPSSPFVAFLPSRSTGGRLATRGEEAYLEEDAIQPLEHFHRVALSIATDGEGQLWEGPMAREGLFRELPSAGAILLALPVQVGPLPGDTFLPFSRAADSLSDNRLYLQEVYGMVKPVDVYILPSVVPGLRDEASWPPLAEALRYSRGQSLLVHRWAATGAPSAELAEDFLGRWPAGGGAPQCLQAARHKYLAGQNKRPELAHPHYWAGYLAYGLPEAPAAPAGIPRFWIIAAVGGLILIGWLVRMH